MYISMKMEIVSEKFKYEKPQIEKVDLKLNQNVCQASMTVGVGSFGGSYHHHENIYDDFDPNDASSSHWGGDKW